ncbi:RagB/SusD family nutrient uptake outer membrane protein [Parafilimonas sp.]|uniref:RagB/SusD family nutrient uptake outer membrane protein n=1 Tax=Parafilimonas sp. TaxID=1969739 RepID=UPI0039E4C73C
MLEDILTEKRKELAFEGNRFWDLYRLQRNFTKVVEQTLGTTLSISLPTTVGSRFLYHNLK